MNRKSPNYSATLFNLGTKKKGNDGNMWIVTKTSSGTKRWTKFDKPKKKILTHDNGSRPFRIDIYDNVIKIMKSDYDDYIYSGISYKNYVKIYLGIDKSKNKQNGNSVLIQLKNKFVFVGHIVYEFVPLDTIKKFYSYLGNSDVPYPVAIGSDYVYFMLDNEFVPIDAFDLTEKSAFHNMEDVYGIFYGHVKNASNTYKNINASKKKFKKYKKIM